MRAFCLIHAFSLSDVSAPEQSGASCLTRACLKSLRNMYGKWVKLALDTSLLAFECQLVIGLRLMTLT